jgi:mannose-6-phosphate isomerase-like protein (cupin superfamily)
MEKRELKNSSRRNFLRSATAAAAAGIALHDAHLLAAPAKGQAEASPATASFKLFTAEHFEADIKAMQAAPANNTIIEAKTYTVILTVETAKSAKEFEWHEGRDHILQIVDGSTVYAVGGIQAAYIPPGEWLALVPEGATTMTLKKGDMLVIPRGTPHRRSTEGSVTLTLISPMGTASA